MSVSGATGSRVLGPGPDRLLVDGVDVAVFDRAGMVLRTAPLPPGG